MGYARIPRERVSSLAHEPRFGKNGRNHTTKAVGKEFGVKATAKIKKVRFFLVLLFFYVH